MYLNCVHYISHKKLQHGLTVSAGPDLSWRGLNARTPCTLYYPLQNTETEHLSLDTLIARLGEVMASAIDLVPISQYCSNFTFIPLRNIKSLWFRG